MAIGTASMTTGSGTNLAVGTSGSITPTGNRLYLVPVSSRTSSGTGVEPNQPTLTGLGLTWVAVGSCYYDNTSSSRKKLSLFRGMGASPTPGSVVIDFAAQTQTNIQWAIDEFSSTDTSGVNGAGAIVQSVSGSVATTGTILSGTLAAFGNVNNATFGACTNAGGTLNAVTPMTVIDNVRDNGGGTNSALTLLDEFNVGNVGTVTFTDNTANELGLIAVEIKAAAVVASTTAGWMNLGGVGN